ncbi:ArdC family protein [Klebsiella pneumoniae]|nr:ArdC family protein [Klebsiella pneumoniae]
MTGDQRIPAGAVRLLKNEIFNQADIYQTVTDSIIAALESGVKPWCARGFATAQRRDYRPPPQLATGTAYSGINIMLLWCSAAKQGFQDERWLTYKQAQELGARFVKVNTARRPSFTRLWRKRTRTGKSKNPDAENLYRV